VYLLSIKGFQAFFRCPDAGSLAPQRVVEVAAWQLSGSITRYLHSPVLYLSLLASMAYLGYRYWI